MCLFVYVCVLGCDVLFCFPLTFMRISFVVLTFLLIHNTSVSLCLVLFDSFSKVCMCIYMVVCACMYCMC